MFRLAHLSDVHLGPLPPFKRRQLISKRITGYANWRLNRKSSMQGNILDDLISHIKISNPDHIALSGDLVNLALPEEISRMETWLENFAPAEQLSITLGNHDTYVPAAFQNVLKAWRPYMEGDVPVSGNPFPYLRRRGVISLIGVNSGVATLPFMASGLFDEEQAKRLEQLLIEAKKEKSFRVVMIHHPPFENATSWSKRLIGAQLFREVIENNGAELVLHGHTHIESYELIKGPTGDVPVVGVPSASKAPARSKKEKNHHPGAQYNLFEISGKQGNWSCVMDQFGYADGETEIAALGSRKLYGNLKGFRNKNKSDGSEAS